MTTIQFADEPDQEERIAKLRQELEKLGGSAMTLESMPADMEEEFLRQVLEYETAEPISLFRLLENSGVEIPSPDQLDDGSLPAKLKEIVERMASRACSGASGRSERWATSPPGTSSVVSARPSTSRPASCSSRGSAP